MSGTASPSTDTPAVATAEDLPEVLARIAVAAGMPDALRVAHELGGSEIYIPVEMDATHRIARAVGLDLGRTLMDVFGPGKLLVPLGPIATFKRVRQRIRELLREGYSRQEIVRMVRCHQRTVQRIRAEMIEEGQGDLFRGFPPFDPEET